MKKAFRILFPCCFILTLAFISSTIQSDDTRTVPLTMSPYKIILNAKCIGSEQDIQAILSVSPTVYENICGDISLRFGDETDTIETSDFRYCYVDTNLLVSFDRKAVQQYLIDNGIIGNTTAIVTGTFTEDGNVITFEGTDAVEILAPSRN